MKKENEGPVRVYAHTHHTHTTHTVRSLSLNTNSLILDILTSSVIHLISRGGDKPHTTHTTHTTHTPHKHTQETSVKYITLSVERTVPNGESCVVVDFPYPVTFSHYWFFFP